MPLAWSLVVKRPSEPISAPTLGATYGGDRDQLPSRPAHHPSHGVAASDRHRLGLQQEDASLNRSRARVFAAAIALVLILAACASDGGAADPTPDSPSAGAPMSEPAAAEPSVADETTAPEPRTDVSGVDWATVDLTTIDWATVDMRQVNWRVIGDNPTASELSEEAIAHIRSRRNPGHATLTIGDQVFEFDNFDCASGHENTESDTFSFTTNSFGEFDGVRTQMQFTVSDESSTGQTEGEGVRHRISFDDIDDFENPSIDWSMGGADSVSIDGYELSVSGTFNDGLTEGVTEEIPGTLEAECSDESRF